MGKEDVIGAILNKFIPPPGAIQEKAGSSQPQTQVVRPQAGPPTPASIIPNKGENLLTGFFEPKNQPISQQEALRRQVIAQAEVRARKSGVFEVPEPVDPNILRKPDNYAHLEKSTFSFPSPPMPAESKSQQPISTDPEEQLFQKARQLYQDYEGQLTVDTLQKRLRVGRNRAYILLQELNAQRHGIQITDIYPETTGKPRKKLLNWRLRPFSTSGKKPPEAPISDPFAVVPAEGGQYLLINDTVLRDKFEMSQALNDNRINLAMEGSLVGTRNYQGKLRPISPDYVEIITEYIKEL